MPTQRVHTRRIVREALATAAISICAATAQPTEDAMFHDYGIAANTAESRGIVCTTLKDGRNIIVAVAYDTGSHGFLLQTDVKKGTTTQISCPPEVPQRDTFGSIISANGHFYTGQGNTLLEYDPASAKWTYFGTPESGLAHYMSFTEEPGGTRIWAAGHPTCHLISFDPATKKATSHGRLDESENYPQSLAVDNDGWVYAGIGTARCNLVAYNPETGEKQQLLPEEARKHGTGLVFRCKDGTVRGVADGKHYLLTSGTIQSIADVSKASPKAASGSVYYGQIRGAFDDGTKLLSYDMPEKHMEIRHPAGSKTTVKFEYQSGGAQLTSLCNGPGNTVYASSCHPMHLARLDTASAKLTDLGGIPAVGGGNFCAMVSTGDTLFGTEYSGGRLWAYDTKGGWHPAKRERHALGISAQDLVARGRVENGHFTFLKSETLAFLCGDSFDAIGHFPLNAPKAGNYFLQVLPFQYPTYCDVQLLFDGKPQGPALRLSKGEGPGETLTFGPFNLEAGEHTLTLDVIETPGQKPWCSLITARLSPERVPSLLVEKQSNPRMLAQWKTDICRPRTILKHPGDDAVAMAGFAGYGLCGGGIGIYNLNTETPTLLTAEKDLLPGHSCITLKALPSGDLVGGTSVSAPGGGHAIAAEAKLFILDWKTRKIRFEIVPVEAEKNIISLETVGNYVLGLTAGGHFFVLDSTTQQIVHRDRVNSHGSVPRHAFQKAADGTVYAMLSRGILQLDPDSWTFKPLGIPPKPVTAGGACMNDQLFYASRAHIWGFTIP